MASPPGDSYALPEESPSEDGGSLVGVAANYAIYVEMGHHTRGGGSWVPAQPFFYPAVEQGAEVFGEEGQNLEAYLGGGV